MSGAEGEAENICSYNRQVTIGADRDPTPIDFFDCLYGVTAGTGSDLTLCRFTVNGADSQYNGISIRN